MNLYEWSGTSFHEPLVEQFVQAIGVFPVAAWWNCPVAKWPSSLPTTACAVWNRVCWFCRSPTDAA